MVDLQSTHQNADLANAINKVVTSLKLPFTPGNVYFVLLAADPGYAELYNRLQGQYEDGSFTVQPSVAAAYAATVTNRNDVVVLSGNGTHTLTEMLVVAKNRVHFVGLDIGSRSFGQAAKLQLAVATGATNVFTMKNTGIRNSFTGIKFVNGSTVAEGLYCVGEGGEYAVYDRCEFYKSTDLDETEAAELVLNGDSAVFRNCTIGSLADAVAGSSIKRAAVKLTKGVVGTNLVTRDSVFENCLFWKQCADTTNVFINADGATDVERLLLLKSCGFINNIAGANNPAVCIRLGATLTVGSIVLDPNCYAVNVTKIATATGVFVTGAAVNSGQGIAVNAA